MRRRVSVFGSTGSIGRNTVALLAEQGGSERYDAVALSGAQNVALLAEQAMALGARMAVTADPAQRGALEAQLGGTGIETLAGPEGLAEAAGLPADWVMSAIVGAAGLEPSLLAAEHGGVLALANKESLVCAGALLKRIASANGTRIVPVDSEHSAIFQALRGERAGEIERIILTASGGPFRDWSLERMAKATPEQARAHPKWDMGMRISIDSASLFNKALEVIETKEIFEAPSEQIEVVVHPQAIVHSMVGFRDGSIMAQMGPSDMRGAIGFALNWPDRAYLPVERLDLSALGALEFNAVDTARFPALTLAYKVLDRSGLSGALFNAAKEAALDAFIAGRLGFLDMARVVEQVMQINGESAAAAGAEYGLSLIHI